MRTIKLTEREKEIFFNTKIKENKEIIGYYVLDETKSTTVKTIYL